MSSVLMIRSTVVNVATWLGSGSLGTPHTYHRGQAPDLGRTGSASRTVSLWDRREVQVWAKRWRREKPRR